MEKQEIIKLIKEIFKKIEETDPYCEDINNCPECLETKAKRDKLLKKYLNNYGS